MEIQGILMVCDIRGVPAHQLSCGQAAPTSWMEKFCSLQSGKIWIYGTEHLNHLYPEGDGHMEMMNGEHHHDSRSSPDENVRRDAPHERLQRGEGFQATGGHRSYIQKKISPSIRLARSTRMTAGKENVLPQSTWVSQGIGSNKPESELGSNFFQPTLESPEMLDLSSGEEAVVRPLHHSILGKEHCFEVITVSGSRCFCCKSAGEREAWIEKLKRTLNPNLDNSRRMEHQLSLWVQEAKGIQIKKKYFCEICLDRQLYARTTSKPKEEGTTFWGEQFEFTSIPEVEDITIHLYKDSDKKKKKDKDYVGLINISIKSLKNRQTFEKWYPLSTPSGKNKNNSGETMAIRIKARFQSFCILPMEQYKELGEYITGDYMKLCKALHGNLSVSKKDELSMILVHVMHGAGKVKEFMTDLVMNDIAKVEEESLIFRENTLATKAVEHFLRLVGMGYLHEALGDFVYALYESDEDCEVDGSRLPLTAILDQNQKNLQMCCEIAMHKILGSIKFFPLELRDVFSRWHECCEKTNRNPRIASRLITATLFLRLICPAILNPYLFGLANELPRPNAARTLTLVAKVIQNLANRSRFGDKEEYMKFMNSFVREQWEEMGNFLRDVADVNKASAGNGFDGYIDLGKELAKLHSFLRDNLPEMDQNIVNELGDLPEIISTLSKYVENPPILTMSHSEPQIMSAGMNRAIGSSLERICEDARLSNVAEHIDIPDTNVPARQTLDMVAGGLPSLAKDRAAQFQSDNSISTTGSFNNSNNSQRALFAPLENVMESSEKSNRHHANSSNGPSRIVNQQSKPPLSFSNPAYLQQIGDLRRGLSSPAVLSSIVAGGDGDHSFKGVDNSTTVNSKLQGSNLNPTPIAFSNPLQTLRSQNTSNHNSNRISHVPSPRPRPSLDSVNNKKLSSAIEALQQMDRDADHSTLESSESDHIGVNGEDTLSSRESSTTTGSLDPVVKNSIPARTVNDQPPEKTNVDKKVKSSKAKSRSIINEVNEVHVYRKMSAPVISTDFIEQNKVTAVATSTTIPISSARHCTGLQRRQQPQQSSHANRQQEANDNPHESFNNPRRASLSAGMQVTPSPRANRSRPRNGRNGSSGIKSQRIRFPDPQTAVMTPIDGPDVVDDVVHTEKTAQPVVSNTSNAARVKIPKWVRPAEPPNSGKPAFQRSSEVIHGGRRPDHPRLTAAKVNQSQTNDASAVLPATPEDPLSPEERTAQWVLSSIAPVPKDPHVQPVGSVPHRSMVKPLTSTNANYDELVSCLKMDLDALSSRLCEAEDSSRAFSKREESLLEQLKERDRREAKLLEKLRLADEKIAHQIQEKEEKKKEFSQRVTELEMKRERERKELQLVINEKDKIVSKQRTHIASLEESNARLKRTINEMRYSSSSSSPSSVGKEKPVENVQHHSRTSYHTGRHQQDRQSGSKQSKNENYQSLTGRFRHRERPQNSDFDNGIHNTSPNNGEYKVETLSFAPSTSSSV